MFFLFDSRVKRKILKVDKRKHKIKEVYEKLSKRRLECSSTSLK